jgi:hypothetical protein
LSIEDEIIQNDWYIDPSDDKGWMFSLMLIVFWLAFVLFWNYAHKRDWIEIPLSSSGTILREI